MSEEILLQFLEAGVVDVGSDDTKLEKLRATAQGLAGILTQSQTLAVLWTLAACDPQISAADPTIASAWTALKSNWVTVANAYQSPPVAILRALLLDALVQVATKDYAVAIAFVNSARNMLPFMQLGEEAAVWRKAVTEIEERVDQRAEAEWATPDSIDLSAMSASEPQDLKINPKAHVTNRETLKGKIYAAAGPTGGDHNPYWPQNQLQWAQEFAARLTTAVADTIDSVEKANAIPPVDLAPAFKKLSSEVGDYVGQAMKAFSGATAGLQRRTNLLWWKEALYSPSLRVGYRDMAPFTAASAMALDLFEQVPAFSPASVSAFLNEAILLLPSAASAAAARPSEIVKGLLQDQKSGPLRGVAKDLCPAAEGRRPMIGLLGHVSADGLVAINFREVTGLGDEAKMSPDQWGAHVFRELQAQRVTRPTPPQAGQG